MRVTVERSGGFAGITKSASVDRDALAPADAEVMDELLRALDDAAPHHDAPSHERDRFEYAVTLETREGSRTITMGESEASPSLRRLIEWVTATADRSDRR
jgi:Emfourin